MLADVDAKPERDAAVPDARAMKGKRAMSMVSTFIYLNKAGFGDRLARPDPDRGYAR
jgi:hypothetical protein